jgi:hypothetical protein
MEVFVFKLPLVIPAWLLLTHSGFAQGTVVKVVVNPSGEDSGWAVASLISGKIGSTLRHALSNPKDAELGINVICIALDVGRAVACTAASRKDDTLGSGRYSHLLIGPTAHGRLSEWTVRNRLHILGLKPNVAAVRQSIVPYRAW